MNESNGLLFGGAFRPYQRRQAKDDDDDDDDNVSRSVPVLAQMTPLRLPLPNDNNDLLFAGATCASLEMMTKEQQPLVVVASRRRDDGGGNDNTKKERVVMMSHGLPNEPAAAVRATFHNDNDSLDPPLTVLARQVACCWLSDDEESHEEEEEDSFTRGTPKRHLSLIDDDDDNEEELQQQHHHDRHSCSSFRTAKVLLDQESSLPLDETAADRHVVVTPCPDYQDPPTSGSYLYNEYFFQSKSSSSPRAAQRQLFASSVVDENSSTRSNDDNKNNMAPTPLRPPKRMQQPPRPLDKIPANSNNNNPSAVPRSIKAPDEPTGLLYGETLAALKVGVPSSPAAPPTTTLPSSGASNDNPAEPASSWHVAFSQMAQRQTNKSSLLDDDDDDDEEEEGSPHAKVKPSKEAAEARSSVVVVKTKKKQPPMKRASWAAGQHRAGPNVVTPPPMEHGAVTPPTHSKAAAAAPPSAPKKPGVEEKARAPMPAPGLLFGGSASPADETGLATLPKPGESLVSPQLPALPSPAQAFLPRRRERSPFHPILGSTRHGPQQQQQPVVSGTPLEEWKESNFWRATPPVSNKKIKHSPESDGKARGVVSQTPPPCTGLFGENAMQSPAMSSITCPSGLANGESPSTDTLSSADGNTDEVLVTGDHSSLASRLTRPPPESFGSSPSLHHHAAVVPHVPMLGGTPKLSTGEAASKETTSAFSPVESPHRHEEHWRYLFGIKPQPTGTMAQQRRSTSSPSPPFRPATPTTGPCLFGQWSHYCPNDASHPQHPQFSQTRAFSSPPSAFSPPPVRGHESSCANSSDAPQSPRPMQPNNFSINSAFEPPAKPPSFA